MTELCGKRAKATVGAQGLEGLPPRGWRLPEASTACQVADAATALWFDIDTSLRPILGAGGVAALYHRSLSQAKASHPCLHASRELDPPDAWAGIDLPLLHAALSRQPPATTAAAVEAWFAAFRALLASLVGVSLTETLLRSVRGASPDHPPVQDMGP